jgi:D-alanine-D-alanine ligase
VLLERFVEGRELAVSVLGDEPLPIVEAIPAAGDRYDFEARYEIGRTTFACPAELGEAEAGAVTGAALAAYEALGCSGFSRVDVILAADGPQVLEVNAIPGLTDTSLLPQAAEAAGISFERLVERILELAPGPAVAPRGSV